MLRRTPLRKKSVTKQSTLKNKADSLWGLRIRSLGECEMSGYDPLGKGLTCSAGLQAAHIKSRRFASTRHLLENGICLCVSHHRWSHDHPDLFTDWVNFARPGLLDRLNAILRETVKTDYRTVLERLKNEAPE